MKTIRQEWKVNTASMLKELVSNNDTAIMRIPVNIFKSLLAKVGERAAELNDPELNVLMCRLAIYSVADPYDKDFNPKIVNKILKKAESIVK